MDDALQFSFLEIHQWRESAPTRRRTSAEIPGDEKELDQKSGMENLQIRWRWLDRVYAIPAFPTFDWAYKNIHFGHGDHRQLDVLINGFVMVEGDLGAIASWVLIGRRFLRFAVTVGRAATFGASEHKILFAGGAPTPDKCSE
jgi:hypothetical protein